MALEGMGEVERDGTTRNAAMGPWPMLDEQKDCLGDRTKQTRDVIKETRDTASANQALTHPGRVYQSHEALRSRWGRDAAGESRGPRSRGPGDVGLGPLAVADRVGRVPGAAA